MILSDTVFQEFVLSSWKPRINKSITGAEHTTKITITKYTSTSKKKIGSCREVINAVAHMPTHMFDNSYEQRNQAKLNASQKI